MRYCLFLICVLCSILAIAQDNKKVINAKATAVTAYLNGAEITHSASVSVGKGKSSLIFTGIAANINEKSIRASATGDVKISSISYEQDFMEDKPENTKIKTLQDSLKKFSRKITEVNYEIESFEEEKKLLTKNNLIGGQNTGVSSGELQKIADLYRTRLKDINSQLLKHEENKSNLGEYIEKINRQLNELNARKDQPTPHIIVIVSSEAQVNSTIELKYHITEAGWDPYYDIRAKDVSSPLSLDYKGKIFNNSGLDWNEVKLTLSTADPSLSAQKPKLDPWTLNYNNQDFSEGYLNKQGYIADEVYKSDKKGKSVVKNQSSSIDVSELTVDFEIKTPYTIPSNNKLYIVDIQTIEIPASYAYLSIPKIDKDAFLLASITGWESLNLIEAPANIYYAGTFVGESHIDTRFANDTLDISLGRDKKVSITRTKKQDFTSKKFFGMNKKENFTYEISIRNNNKVPIEIEIQDQIPVAQESDIKVETLETTGAKPEEQSGILKWNLKLAPSESKILTVSFAVQYPKTKIVKIRKSKQTYRSARFL